jgi:hypothetical protein
MVIRFTQAPAAINAGLPFRKVYLEAAHGEGLFDVDPMRRFTFLLLPLRPMM